MGRLPHSGRNGRNTMTNNREKDIATFFAGAMAWHAFTHLALAIFKSEEPHKKLGIRMTPARNTAAAGITAAVSLFLARYVLKRRGLPTSTESLAQH